MVESRFTDAQGIAAYLGKRVSWVKYQLKKKTIPAHKRGRAFFFDPNEVDAWIRSSTNTARKGR